MLYYGWDGEPVALQVLFNSKAQLDNRQGWGGVLIQQHLERHKSPMPALYTGSIVLFVIAQLCVYLFSFALRDACAQMSGYRTCPGSQPAWVPCRDHKPTEKHLVKLRKWKELLLLLSRSAWISPILTSLLPTNQDFSKQPQTGSSPSFSMPPSLLQMPPLHTWHCLVTFHTLSLAGLKFPFRNFH